MVQPTNHSIYKKIIELVSGLITTNNTLTTFMSANKLEYVNITSDFTFLESHHGKVLLVDSVSDVDATTAAGLSDGWYCTVQKQNTGNIIIVTGASTTVISEGTTLDTQYKSFFIDQQGSDVFHAEGTLV